MPDLTIALDGDNEPTVWLGDPDDTPIAVFRKCDLATEGRDEVWAAWEAFVAAERVAHTEWGVQYEDGEVTSCGWMPGVSERFARQALNPDPRRVVAHLRVPSLVVQRTRIISANTVTAWTPAGDPE